MKNIRTFISENIHFWVVKFSVYLNRCVSVMDISKKVLTMKTCLSLCSLHDFFINFANITKTRLFKYIENFTSNN